MDVDKKIDEELLEWYGDVPIANVASSNEAGEGEKEKETPEKVVDKIESGAELHKAMAMIKALDTKLALLSGAFTSFNDPERKNKLKGEVKELAKRILKIVEEI